MSGSSPKSRTPNAPAEKAPAPKQQFPKSKKGERKGEWRQDQQFPYRPPSDQRQAYMPPRRSKPRRQEYVPFVKGRFVQSSFRLCVEDATPDVVQASFEADAFVDWANVKRVDLMCEEPPKCPICLEEELVVPKITKCGHVFCLPCIMRYFLLSSREPDAATRLHRCPVCTDRIGFADLRTVRFQMVRPVKPGERLTIALLRRDVRSTVVRLAGPQPEAGKDNDFMVTDIPFEHDEGWHLTHIVRLIAGTGARLLLGERQSLRRYRPMAIALGDTELLPSIDAAANLLEKELDALGVMDSEEDPHRPLEQGYFITVRPPQADSYAAEEDWRTADWWQEMQDDSAAGSSENNQRSGGTSKLYFYQSGDGRLVFLQPFFTKLLLHEYGGRWELLPPLLQDLRIERVEELTVTEEARKRFRFLSHLPVGCQVRLVDLDLRGRLSAGTREHFADAFAKRRQDLRQEKNKERKQDRKAKERAEWAEEEYYRNLGLMVSERVAPPTKEDFAVPLPGSSNVAVADDTEGAAQDDEQEDQGGPTLAEILKQRVTSGKLRKGADDKKKGPAAVVVSDCQEAFPTLGGGSEGAGGSGAAASSSRGQSSCAWGAGRGSARVTAQEAPRGRVSSDNSQVADSWVAEPEVPESWEETAAPSYDLGEALEVALRGAKGHGDGDVGPTVETTTAGNKTGGKKDKKKKGTTMRLFG